MKKKLNVIERVLKSSNAPKNVIETAFSTLSNNNLRLFSKIMLSHYPFKECTDNNLIIDNNTLKDTTLLIPSFLNSAEDQQIYYYIEGILRRNLEKIKHFCKLEEEFLYELLFNNYESAEKKIIKIEEEFGQSYWSVLQYLNVSYLKSEASPIKTLDVSNDIINLYLKIHKNQLEDILTNPILKEEDEDDDEFTGNDFKIMSHIRYKVYGLSSSINKINMYDVLRYESASTLIDLYKSFELLCYQILSGYSNTANIPYIEVSNFIKDINHYLMINHRNKDPIKKEKLKIYDMYTDGKYDYVINELKSTNKINISHLKLLSKSLNYKNIRLPDSNLYIRQSNLLADIYNKGESFSASLNYLYNLNVSFRGMLFFTIINHSINLERKGYYNSQEEYIVKSELIFSPDTTPFKLDLFLNRDEVIKSFEGLNDSSTLKNYIGNTPIEQEGTSLTAREVKYISKKCIKNNDLNTPINLISQLSEINDPELIRIYIRCLSLNGMVENAADYFLQSYDKYRQSLDYFITYDFYSKLQNMARCAKNISIPISLYLCKDSFVDKKLNTNATGISIGKTIKYIGINNPSELQFDETNWREIFFLSDVCSKEILTKSLLYRTQDDAYNERIKICNALITKKLGNYEKLVNETKILSKRKVLELAAKQINQTKIYADKDYVLNKTWDDLQIYYNEYVKFKNISIANIDNAIERMMLNTDMEKKKKKLSPGLQFLSDQLSQYMSLGSDYRLKCLYQMLKTYTEEFCFGIKGLNSYLSTRIRHGTFMSTITNQLVINGLYPSDEGNEEDNFLKVLSGLNNSIIDDIRLIRIKFRDKLNTVINDIINKWIQVLANKKGLSTSKFNFEFSELDLLLIQKNIGVNPTFHECCIALSNCVEDKLTKSCETISSLLDVDTRRVFIKLFDELEVDLDNIKDRHKISIPAGLMKIITISKQHVLNQLDIIIGWFKVNQESYNESYDFDIITEIIKSMTQIESISLNEKIKLSINNDRLSSIVDLIYNIVNNAIHHSGVSLSSLKVDIDIDCNESEGILITVKNNNASINDYELINMQLKRYEHSISNEKLKEAIQSEGGSGFARVRYIIRHELYSEEKLLIGYLSKDTFSVKISFKNGNGIYCNENINC
ncbi:hypothetical protein WMR60_000795 [Providencia rettgeri]